MRYNSAEEYLRDWPDGVSGGKGQDVAQSQLNSQNALVQQQLTNQKAVQDQIQKSFGGYLTGDQGYDPAMMSALTSQFMNQNSSAFQGANSNLTSSLAARGMNGGALPGGGGGGSTARGVAELEGAKASTQSSGLLGLGIQNLQQALQNRFNAGSLINGQAAQFGNNIGTFNQGATNALGSYISAVNAPGWMSGLQGIASSAAGGFGSGFGQSLGKKAGGAT